ncbi:hypothetical protein LHEJCM20397_13370 [Lactobacillus helveticus]|nr:hypothetical protein LHEJCM1006_01460 [Lactobacillus helveticus]GFP17789.1 hypothetical protein LHEJCM20397_13370 [Lactobacillus helveticus]GIP66724.1 hypothetical protein LhelvAHU1049_09290 [Lactobacillus helveticus]
MITGRVQIRQIALMAMLTAMCVVLRIFSDCASGACPLNNYFGGKNNEETK